MHLKTKNIIDQQILAAMPANKNKIIIAGILVVVMLLLWVKFMLRNNGPDVASAGTTTTDSTTLTETQVQPVQPPIRISYVKLSSIPGRHDVITKDIFSVRNWRGFGQKQSSAAQAVQAGTSDPGLVRQNDLKEFTEKTTVEAISLDTATGRYEAYINNKVLSEGSVFQAKADDRLYRFVVKNIQNDRVILVWGDFVVTLKMVQPETADNQ